MLLHLLTNPEVRKIARRIAGSVLGKANARGEYLFLSDFCDAIYPVLGNEFLRSYVKSFEEELLHIHRVNQEFLEKMCKEKEIDIEITQCLNNGDYAVSRNNHLPIPERNYLQFKELETKEEYGIYCDELDPRIEVGMVITC